jgi:nitrite reductase/ring-hydroxylating ferredoxin subunit
MQWHAVAEVSHLIAEEMIAVRFADQHVLVYRTATGVYATGRRCTHQGADLLRGFLDGDVIECPVHQGRFDLRTGAALNAPACEPLQTYEVRINDGRVELRLK